MAGQLIKYSQPTSQEPIPLEVRPLRSQGTLDFLELLSYLMDRRFVFPGTNFRFGLNTLFLLLPVIGDLLPTIISFTILAIGLNHYKVPRIVAARMVVNSLLDNLISLVPVLGNVWDVLYKADTRNVQLLREYVSPGPTPPRPLWHHWLFILGALGVLVLVVALVVIGLLALFQLLAHEARTY